MKKAIASLALTACASAWAAPWEISGATQELSLDAASVGPSLRYPGTTGLWLTYAPSLSVDCSPPSGCYARTQRIYYVFNCSPRYAMPMERISMDLNGSVIKREMRSESEPYSVYADTGAALILSTYCPIPRERRERD